MKNCKKATKENYSLIKRALYEFTGLQYFLLPSYPNHYGCNTTFFDSYYYFRAMLKKMVDSGEVCKFPLLKNGIEEPYIINQLAL